MFKIGDKVICINSTQISPLRIGIDTDLHIGGVYVISGFNTSNDFKFFGQSYSWRKDRFMCYRPMVEVILCLK